MEYLMSYGWAVLVALVVGVTLWQLGFLEVSSTTPPLATGFQAVKPLLPSCHMANGLAGIQWLNGFACEFANAAGQSIRVVNITGTVDGKACQVAAVGKTIYGPDGYWFECWDDGMTNCFTFTSVACLANPADPCFYEFGSDEVFFVYVFSWQDDLHNSATSDPHGPCMLVKAGDPYDVFVDVGYTVDIGGVDALKHSAGHIRVVGE